RDRGIRITDPKTGKPTLSHKHYDRAHVPGAVRDDWAEFKRVREIGAVANKVTEIGGLLAASSDGRLHPSIRGLGAHTGRMSVGSPALQNLPEDLRPLLLADPGH